MTAALALATFAALCLFVRLAMRVTEHGLIGTGYLLSAWFHAFSDGLLYGKRAYAEYRRQALDAAPQRNVQAVGQTNSAKRTEPLVSLSLVDETGGNAQHAPVRHKPALLGRLARIAGKAARRPVIAVVSRREA